MAGPGALKTGGRQSGTPNKITSDVKAMVLAALDRASGEDYLLAQAHDNPKRSSRCSGASSRRR